MKTLITVLALAALATTSAIAKAPKAEAIHGDAADIHRSYAGGNQTFPTRIPISKDGPPRNVGGSGRPRGLGSAPSSAGSFKWAAASRAQAAA